MTTITPEQIAELRREAVCMRCTAFRDFAENVLLVIDSLTSSLAEKDKQIAELERESGRWKGEVLFMAMCLRGDDIKVLAAQRDAIDKLKESTT